MSDGDISMATKHWVRQLKENYFRSIPMEVASSMGGICAAISYLDKVQREEIKAWCDWLDNKRIPMRRKR